MSPLILVLFALLALGVRADFYDLAEEDLYVGVPSVRRVIGMYSAVDAPSFLGSTPRKPIIELNLEFTATPIPVDNSPPTPQALPHPFTTLEDAPAAPAAAAATPAAPADAAAAATPADATPAAPAAKTGDEPSETGVERHTIQPETKEASKQPRVQVLVLQDTTLDSIGFYQDDGTLVSYCCNKEYVDKGICDTPGTLIINPAQTKPYMLFSAYFPETLGSDPKANKAQLVPDNGRFEVTQTGEHILIFSNCDPRLEGYITSVTGTGTWRNAFGYLPGRLFGFLPFYFGMVVVYLVLTVTWAVFNCLYWKDIAGIQHCISTTLVLSLIEVTLWFLDYYNFNQSGNRHMYGIIAAILFTVLRLTVSRMLVVAVSIGFPVVRPNLSIGSKVKIVCLGFIYFVFEAALEVVTRYAQTNETAEHWRIFLSLPVAILNAVFYWWIFTALHDLLQFLEQQNQHLKLAMYKNFTHVLAGSLVAAVIFAIYQIYFMSTNQLALHWSLLWLLDGGFQLMLYTLIFICMAYLWRPSTDSRRYAYAELSVGNSNPGGIDDDEDETEFAGDVEMAKKQAGEQGDSARFTVDEDEA